MAIGLVISAKASNTFGAHPGVATNIGVDTSGANFLLAVSCDYSGAGNDLAGGTLPTISDSKSNTWSKLTQYITPNTSTQVTVWYSKNPTVGSAHTVTATGSYNCAFFMAFSGVDTSAPFDVENGTGVNMPGSTIQPGSITPASNGELLFLISSVDAGVTSAYTTNNSFTNGDSVDSSLGINEGGYWSYLIQETAGAINPTITFNNTQVSVAVTIKAFKASAAIAESLSLTATMGLSFPNNVAVLSAFTIAETGALALANSINVPDAMSVAVTPTLTVEPANNLTAEFDMSIAPALSFATLAAMIGTFTLSHTPAVAFATQLAAVGTIAPAVTLAISLASNILAADSMTLGITGVIAFSPSTSVPGSLSLGITAGLSFLNNIAAVNPLQLPISVAVMWTPSANIPSEFTISASLGLAIVDARGADVPFQLGPDSAVGPSGIFRAAEITGRPGQLRPGASGVPGIFRPDED